MSDFIPDMLVERGLKEAYRNRPPYQQNDSICWITRAKREETKQKRLAQMLVELASSDRYMKMTYSPRHTVE